MIFLDLFHDNIPGFITFDTRLRNFKENFFHFKLIFLEIIWNVCKQKSNIFGITFIFCGKIPETFDFKSQKLEMKTLFNNKNIE